MEFDESKFSEYVNEKYGFVIDYFIIENISYDVIKFMTQYANKCEVANFRDTTVDKSLNDADYCPKYDKDEDKKMRNTELKGVISRTLVKDIISDAVFEAFINEHMEKNTHATLDIIKLSQITFGVLKEQVKSREVKTLYPNILDYIGTFIAIRPEPDGGDKLSELMKKYPYEYIEKMKQDIIRIKLMTIGDFEKTDFEPHVKKYVNSKINSHTKSIMCKYDPPYRYDIHKESNQKENNDFTQCKSVQGFAAPGDISEFFEFAPLYNYCKLFYSLAIDNGTQSYMCQMPIFDNLYWFKNHGLKSICILLYYTNINYVIEFFKKVELSVKQIDEQKGDQPSVCETILQEMPFDIENIKKLYSGNIDDFYNELNHFIKLYLGAYDFMNPYEFVCDDPHRISYVMGILLNYLIQNIIQIITVINLYITKSKLQVLKLQDNIPEYIKLLSYEHNPDTLENNNLFLHFMTNRFNRSYKKIKLGGLEFADCVETGFLALLVYLLSKNGIIDASIVKYKPIEEFFKKYDTIIKINKNSTNEEWSVVLSKITGLVRKGVYEIKSSISNIIILLCETFGYHVPFNVTDKTRIIQIKTLKEMIDLICKNLNQPLTIVDEDIDMIYYMTINKEFNLEVSDKHTRYKYHNYEFEAVIPLEILFNIYFHFSKYCKIANINDFFVTIVSHRKITEICKYTVKISQILNHAPRMPYTYWYASEVSEAYIHNPLYIYLMTKLEYVEDEISLIVKYNSLVDFKFDSKISKVLLLLYFDEEDGINLRHDIINYLVVCCFPRVAENIYHPYIIEILKAILKLRIYRVKKDIIEYIRYACHTFTKIKYDFFMPYLKDNTNVEADILDLIGTDYVTSLKWESPESSPVHIYLKNNTDKPYEDKEKVIRTLRKYLNPSCITSIAKEWYQDPQLSALFNELIKPDDTQKQEQAAAAAPPAELIGGRKYRTKSMKKYKFSYQ